MFGIGQPHCLAIGGKSDKMVSARELPWASADSKSNENSLLRGSVLKAALGSCVSCPVPDASAGTGW